MLTNHVCEDKNYYSVYRCISYQREVTPAWVERHTQANTGRLTEEEPKTRALTETKGHKHREAQRAIWNFLIATIPHLRLAKFPHGGSRPYTRAPAASKAIYCSSSIGAANEAQEVEETRGCTELHLWPRTRLGDSQTHQKTNPNGNTNLRGLPKGPSTNTGDTS